MSEDFSFFGEINNYIWTMSEYSIIIEDTFEGTRIDVALSRYFGLSRNFFQQLMMRGNVIYKGSILKKSYRCKGGELIEIMNLHRFDDDGCLKESPMIQLPILYETDDYAVIYKPKGVYSHPTSLREIGQPSVVGFLYHHYGSVPSIGTFVRAGLLHRLDKETDGLMIVALSEQGLAHFHALFHDKSSVDSLEDKNNIQLKKWYRCTIESDSEKVIQGLHRIAMQLPYIINIPVLAKVPGAQLKSAISIIHKMDILNHCEWGLELEILTGRTHQIRIHCASVLQSPIKGDTLYGTRKQGGPMMLTAFRLSFIDLGGQIQVIELSGQRHDSKGIRNFVHNGVMNGIVEIDGQFSLINMSMEMQ